MFEAYFQKTCNQKFPAGFCSSIKRRNGVGMKAFIRRECRDDPIRDSTQISLYYYARGKVVNSKIHFFHGYVDYR